jgi:U3 small nucleolar RNA-associated protein 25
VPSYFDFVRIRNYLAEKDMPFSFISEYSSKSDVDTARYQFRSGESKILLYSERAHFFRRYMIKGARHLLFYQPPLFEFYAELVNLMEPTQDASCSLLFSIFDQLALERIVGSQKLSKILKSKKEAFMFSL